MKKLLIIVAATSLMAVMPLQAQEWKHTKNDYGKSGILHVLGFETPYTVNCGPSDFKNEPRESTGEIEFLCLEKPDGEPMPKEPLGVQVGVKFCGTPYTLDLEEPYNVYLNGRQYPNGDSISMRAISSMTANPVNAITFYGRLIENDGTLLIELERLKQPRFTVGARFEFEQDASGTFTSGLDEAFQFMPEACRI